jgi:hypothetical protein
LNKKPLLSLEQINNYIESYISTKPAFEISILNESSDDKKYTIFKKLMEYFIFKQDTEIAVSEIKLIIQNYNNLENERIKGWILEYHSLFENELFGFGIDYLDSGDDPDDNLHLTSIDIYVDKTHFMPIIQFWQLQWLLYYKEYHVLMEKRTTHDTKSYYINSQDKNEHSDLEKVKEILYIV